MNRRTLIGIVCIILAIAITFGVAPLVNRMTTDNTTVIRLATDVKQGTEITAPMLETVSVKTETVPEGIIMDPAKIIGKYAASQLYTGDYLSAKKLTNERVNANDAFAGLTGDKVAVSFTIDSFAGGLSGKLQNGDIISIMINDKATNTTYIPGELKYVQIITATTGEGVDVDSAHDGEVIIPTTITVIVTNEQAKLLAHYETYASMHISLVYRGSEMNAAKFIAKQDEYLANALTSGANAQTPKDTTNKTTKTN